MNWAKRRKAELAAVCFERGQVHAAHIFRSRGAPPAVKFCRTESVGGNAPAVLARLKQDLGLQRYRCSTVMGAGDYRFLVMEAPKVPPEEIKEAVRWGLKDLIDYPPETAIVDTLPIAADLDGQSVSASLHVAVVQRRSVESIAQQFRSADLTLDSIDVTELALRNLAALFAEPGMGVAFAWFCTSGSGIAFVANGELCMVRALDPTAEDAVGALQANDTRVLERIELGLQRSIDHFERNFSAVPINRVILAPFAASAALAEYLVGHLSLPVKLAELDKVLDLSAVPELRDPARAGEVLVTLGAALRH